MRDYATISKRLRQYSENCVAYKLDADFANAVTDAADAIEELLAELTTIRKQMPHWISVEERLPEPFVCVLAHIPGEKPFPTVKSAFLEKNGLWYSNGFRYNPEEVTHWCEMPAPPKGGNHDN